MDPATGAFVATLVADYVPAPAASVRLIVITDGHGKDVLEVRTPGIPATVDGGRGDLPPQRWVRFRNGRANTGSTPGYRQCP